jgi:starch synthase (maltosyl-transferring)
MSKETKEPSALGFPDEGRQRVVIENVRPSADAGRYPVKRVAGDTVTVKADIYADGHDHIRSRLRYRRVEESEFGETELAPMGNDSWEGSFPVGDVGACEFEIVAWIDHYETWIAGLKKKVEVDAETDMDLSIGAELVRGAAERATAKKDRERIAEHAELLGSTAAPLQERAGHALDPRMIDLISRYPDRALESTSPTVYPITVDPPKAQFSSWYEMFPRSTYGGSKGHGTLRDCINRLDYVAEMGFDVLYLPPIHPIGRAFRKGPNNALVADKEDPGSPWAIGSDEGGHTAIHPDLGSEKDFQALVREARKRGIDIALDVAFQCSPDHPWVSDHPEWFVRRPDGSIQYAENPPKKYQDIYPLNFESDDWQNLWSTLKSVFDHWIDLGVTIFRVDNPHTKSYPFWEWCISAIKVEHPEAIFLAEAFTRPRRLYGLAKIGFSQSYTYFTWRTEAAELMDYAQELATTAVAEYCRPNFWPNTPDILHEYLQEGGRPAFIIRLILAATLSSNYGIYGPAFELQEATPREPGSEEYLDSEKYEIRRWNVGDPRSLRPLITRVNSIRHDNPALQANRSLRFHACEDPSLLAYSKSSEDGANVILAVVNVDYEHTRAGRVEFSPAAVGLHDSRPFIMTDLLTGESYTWHEYWNYVQLDPFLNPAHIFRLELQEEGGR